HHEADTRWRETVRGRVQQTVGRGRKKYSPKRIERLSRLKSSLPESLAASVKTAISNWQSSDKMKRLWARDAALWTGSDEADWLGWLDIVEEQSAHLAE